ncbi:hypothetical protein SALBM217S_01819 [Streptomyces griseoloalbus]
MRRDTSVVRVVRSADVPERCSLHPAEECKEPRVPGSTNGPSCLARMFAAPVGSIGRQPREDLMRDALDKAAAGGKLVGAALPLAGI